MEWENLLVAQYLSLIHTFALSEDEQTEWLQERTGLSG